MEALIPFVALFAIAAPIAAFAAIGMVLGLRRETRDLAIEVNRLRAALTPAPLPGKESPSTENVATAPPSPEPAISVTRPSVPASSRDAVPADTQAGGTIAPAPATARDGLEQQVLGRWAIWLGAVAIALGGAFLVKYSIDNDLLGPGTRVLLGFCLGLALTLGGELLHRGRAPAARAAAARIAPALVAAGMATLYSSVYAAHALYDFIDTPAAFMALALVSGAAVTLSLRHGPLIAAVGLVGAFAVPAVVKSTAPAPWALFGYLLFVVGGCLALVRRTHWWWLAWLTLAGLVAWSVLWLDAGARDLASVPFTGFLVLGAAAFLLLHRLGEPARWDPAYPFNGDVALIWIAGGVIPLLMLLQLGATNYAPPSLLGAAVLVAVYLGAAYRDPVLDRMSWIAGVFSALAIAAWNLPLPLASPLHPDALNPPPAFAPLASMAAALTALVVGPSFWALWRTPRPDRWAVTTAVTPILVLTALYLRRGDALPEMPWAAIGLAVAGLEIWAATLAARERTQPGLDHALAFFAVAAVAAISLAATMSLERSWLTVALALQLPALAWITERTRVSVLRHVALVISGAVIIRLLLNADLLAAPPAEPIFNWILYGYGMPAVAFAAAARLFSRTGDDRLVMSLEAGTIIASLLLVGLEIRNAFATDRFLGGYLSAGELATQLDAWMIATLLLYWRAGRSGRQVYVEAAKITAIASLLFMAGGPLLLRNPLFSAIQLSETFFFNLLLPLYAVPALLSVALAVIAGRAGEPDLKRGFGAMALILGFVYLSLNIRQLFHGTVLVYGPVDAAESYAYSAVWLIYGGVVLLGGILWANQIIRYAGLVVLCLAISKTFLYDMSALTGLYRAASFLGLGATLLGIGYLYQRFVRPR